jgi:hypothetical protein
MPLPESLQGDTWTAITARNSFPLLVWCAQQGRTISYSFLEEELIRRGLADHHVNYVAYGHPAGAIGSGLIETEEEEGLTLPPLNALIVGRQSRLPGYGCDYYLDRYVLGGRRRILTPINRQALAEQTQEDVFNYQDWNHILELYGMESIEDDIPLELNDEVGDFIPPTQGWSPEGESEQHRTLKNYVLNHPQEIFGQPNGRGWQGTVEFPLPSGDYADVFFEGHGRKVAIEVKSIISTDADLSRGLFQCVKYRAVTRAWQKTLQEIPNGNSILIIQRELPQNLQDTADLLNIEVIVITQAQMH